MREKIFFSYFNDKKCIQNETKKIENLCIFLFTFCFISLAIRLQFLYFFHSVNLFLILFFIELLIFAGTLKENIEIFMLLVYWLIGTDHKNCSSFEVFLIPIFSSWILSRILSLDKKLLYFNYFCDGNRVEKITHKRGRKLVLKKLAPLINRKILEQTDIFRENYNFWKFKFSTKWIISKNLIKHYTQIP